MRDSDEHSGTRSQAQPAFSIVTPVFNTPTGVLEAMIASVRAQTFEAGSTSSSTTARTEPGVREVLREAAARGPARARHRTRGERAHRRGVQRRRGRRPGGIHRFAGPRRPAHARSPRAGPAGGHRRAGRRLHLLRRGQDRRGRSGFAEFRKPAWSPERLRGHMYTCHLSVLRTSCVREVGGFRPGAEGSQDHDLVLRVTERARKVVHIPKRALPLAGPQGSAAGDPDAKPYAWLAGQGRGAGAPRPRRHRRHRRPGPRTGDLPHPPPAGPGRPGQRRDPDPRGGRADLGRATVVRRRGGAVPPRARGHENVEIVVVHDADTPARVLDAWPPVGGPRLELVPHDGPFNFSEKCNRGVTSSYGDAIVLLNDDVEISCDGFVTQLVAPLYEEGVGMTGANLTMADTTVQHAGLAWTTGWRTCSPTGVVGASGPRTVPGAQPPPAPGRQRHGRQPRGVRRVGGGAGDPSLDVRGGRWHVGGLPGQLRRRRPVDEGGRRRATGSSGSPRRRPTTSRPGRGSRASTPPRCRPS